MCVFVKVPYAQCELLGFDLRTDPIPSIAMILHRDAWGFRLPSSGGTEAQQPALHNRERTPFSSMCGQKPLENNNCFTFSKIMMRGSSDLVKIKELAHNKPIEKGPKCENMVSMMFQDGVQLAGNPREAFCLWEPVYLRVSDSQANPIVKQAGG